MPDRSLIVCLRNIYCYEICVSAGDIGRVRAVRRAPFCPFPYFSFDIKDDQGID